MPKCAGMQSAESLFIYAFPPANFTTANDGHQKSTLTLLPSCIRVILPLVPRCSGTDTTGCITALPQTADPELQQPSVAGFEVLDSGASKCHPRFIQIPDHPRLGPSIVISQLKPWLGETPVHRHLFSFFELASIPHGADRSPPRLFPHGQASGAQSLTPWRLYSYIRFPSARVPDVRIYYHSSSSRTGHISDSNLSPTQAKGSE
ncbi:hypothetical protein FB45DRAFT_486942 [Roridomyces roridus]|uniref:Uncharacterized protein n=1 Tax=Roridomyces roridus TaxID=1738132 RepID=A0AAD7AZH5_9AGAR|nr:hypothetical protein FB45DRAFT_486942 [Roridomyces roridus]